MAVLKKYVENERKKCSQSLQLLSVDLLYRLQLPCSEIKLNFLHNQVIHLHVLLIIIIQLQSGSKQIFIYGKDIRKANIDRVILVKVTKLLLH